MANPIGLSMLQEALEHAKWERLFEDSDEKEETEEKEESEVEDQEPEENNDEEGSDDAPEEDDSIAGNMKDEDPPEGPEDDEIQVPEGEAEESEGGEFNFDEIAEKIKFTGPEVEIIDSLIESEVDAISDYTKALNETKNKYARKLYTEILDDESKHVSQLKYLKAMGTDDDYVPKNDEAKEELADILESVIEEIDDLF